MSSAAHHSQVQSDISLVTSRLTQCEQATSSIARTRSIAARTDCRTAKAEKRLYSAGEPITLHCNKHVAGQPKRLRTQVMHMKIMIRTRDRQMRYLPRSKKTSAPPGFSTRATSVT